jgi:hypothetical protein
VLVSIDSRNRLAKVVMNEAGIVAIREDISSVMSREERVRNPGDTDVFIPANSFSLAATVTIPKLGPEKMPAVILVGGQGNQDRDETHYGVSIFGSSPAGWRKRGTSSCGTTGAASVRAAAAPNTPAFRNTRKMS